MILILTICLFDWSLFGSHGTRDILKKMDLLRVQQTRALN